MLISGGEAAACVSGLLGSHSTPRWARPARPRRLAVAPEAWRLAAGELFFVPRRLVPFVFFFTAIVASQLQTSVAIFSRPDLPGRVSASCAPFVPCVSASHSPPRTSEFRVRASQRTSSVRCAAVHLRSAPDRTLRRPLRAPPPLLNARWRFAWCRTSAIVLSWLCPGL